jgi:hypothetical protein
LFVSDPTRDEESLSAELSALRSALREVQAPDDEPALRSAMRARAATRSVTRGPGAVRPTLFAVARARVAQARRPLALAAAGAIAAVALLGVLRVERAQRAERAAASARATGAATAMPATVGTPDVRPAFRPISFSRGLSPAESYSVVRVRLELATNAPGAAAPSAAIEADLLVGEDGLARAIRFDSADTLPVYAAFKPAGGERR